MKILWLLFLASGIVSGFLIQDGSSGNTNTPNNNDITIQNLLNLIVNEQNSRVRLQNKVDQLEGAMDVIQKNANDKINQTQHETSTKLNEMSARLAKMEQFNADVSRQLQKEKNNREHLEQLYANMSIENNLLRHNFASSMSHTDSTFNATMNEVDGLKETLSDMNVTIKGLRHAPVGFSAKSPNTTSGEPLKYQTLINKTGHGYDMSTGVFTCEYPGLYFFTATIFRSPGVYESSCQFHVNNKTQISLSSGTEGRDGYQSGSNSFVFKLKAGDTVSLRSCTGVDHMYEYSSFSGFLISN